MEKIISFIIATFCVGIVGGVLALFKRFSTKKNEAISTVDEQKSIEHKYEIKKQEIIKNNPPVLRSKEEILEEINRYRKLN